MLVIMSHSLDNFPFLSILSSPFVFFKGVGEEALGGEGERRKSGRDKGWMDIRPQGTH